MAKPFTDEQAAQLKAAQLKSVAPTITEKQAAQLKGIDPRITNKQIMELDEALRKAGKKDHQIKALRKELGLDSGRITNKHYRKSVVTLDEVQRLELAKKLFHPHTQKILSRWLDSREHGAIKYKINAIQNSLLANVIHFVSDMRDGSIKKLGKVATREAVSAIHEAAKAQKEAIVTMIGTRINYKQDELVKHFLEKPSEAVVAMIAEQTLSLRDTLEKKLPTSGYTATPGRFDNYYKEIGRPQRAAPPLPLSAQVRQALAERDQKKQQKEQAQPEEQQNITRRLGR